MAKKKANTWGGRREGAGRKKGTKMVEIPKTEVLSVRVTADTQRRVRELRELTKNDDIPFNGMLELWVAEIAKDYGID